MNVYQNPAPVTQEFHRTRKRIIEHPRPTPPPLRPLYAAKGLGLGLGVEDANERFGSENPSEYDFARLRGSEAPRLEVTEEEKGN